MAILYSASKDEVLRMLTIANRSERFWRPRNAELRREAEDRHREASMWLHEHRVPFVYDKTQRCYVEDETDGN